MSIRKELLVAYLAETGHDWDGPEVTLLIVEEAYANGIMNLTQAIMRLRDWCA